MYGSLSNLWSIALLSVVAAFSAAEGDDWPMWRHDAARSGATAEELPPALALHWVRELPPLQPAWLDQEKMQLDAAYEPIIAGQRLFIGSSHDNSVTAYDTRTGSQLWTKFVDGPIRYSPLAWEDKLYFVCDDGYLYCIAQRDGALAWRFRGGPSDRKVLGNERLISMWPARGAPVIADGNIYFAAGIWPFMGIFLHSLDARTGEILWTNDGDGSTYMKQPHNADAFAGVAPQGHLVVAGDRLLVAGGRSVPACYDRSTGKLRYYQLAENAKKGGGADVAAVKHLILNGGAAFDLEAESYLGPVGELFAFDERQLFDLRGRDLRALDLDSSSYKCEETIDRKGAKVKVAKWSIMELAKVEAPAFTAFIKSGSRLFAGAAGRVVALPQPQSGSAQPLWEAKIEGTPVSLIAADGKLIATTLEGRIYCFGGADAAPPQAQRQVNTPAKRASDENARQAAARIFESAGTREGYCLLLGHGPQELIFELAQQDQLRIVVIEPDLAAADSLRLALRAAGIGAAKVTVIVSDPARIELPPYLASIAVVREMPPSEKDQAALVPKVFAALRPFGGFASLPIRGQNGAKALAPFLASPDSAGIAWKPAGDTTLLWRAGPLPGSGDWTHEHADAANTRVSKDSLVKAPLGLLWFGGTSNEAILPRHGHGPQPQVCDGRLFIEGMDLIRAMDIYTGRVLWEASLPGIGELYNNTAHQPGANSSGSNYVSVSDGVYVAYKNSCVVLDPATGERKAEFRLPAEAGEKQPPNWGYISVFDKYLVGGAHPLFNAGLANSRGENDNYSSSSRLVVMDRASGKVLWTAKSRSGFRHNAICIGAQRLYAIDRLSGPELSRLTRRGQNPPNRPRLIAFDLASGNELWSTENDVFGTWLSYAEERDVLVESGRVASDTISDEPKGMRAYAADKGSMLWQDKSYKGPAMIHHQTIMMAGSACDLMTGAPRLREHPLSGEAVEWTWSRNYGCNTPLCSEHLVTFRSGAAGYFDLASDGGTGNFGGFRSSCSNNLIVAGGLLTAPDYTRTCVCSYQNQTSLALVPMPEVETWTFFSAKAAKDPVRRLGINLGAPGDRKADDGTLWLEYPSVGGASPVVEIAMEPSQPQWFRRHSSQVSGAGPHWVAASGAQGITSLRVKLADRGTPLRKYKMNLYFLEPENVSAGERLFAVRVQGKPAFESLDVAREAGGSQQALVKSLSGVAVADELVIELQPLAGSKIPGTLLSGVEVVAEGW